MSTLDVGRWTLDVWEASRRAAALLFLALAACGERPEKKEESRGAVSEMPKLPAFSFQEAQGRPIGSDQLRGRVWVAATVFTRCPTHCPAMCQEMYELQKEFGDEPDFRMLTITVDPAHDTVEVLRRYARGYHAKPDVWYFARHPDRDVVRKFVVEGLKIPWDDDEPLNHSYRLVLVDREGRVRGWYKRSEREKMKELRRKIRGLLDQQP